MEIRTAEGEILEVKEPVVLNQEGEVILEPQSSKSHHSFHTHSFVFQSHRWFKPLSLILGIGLILALFTVGTVIFTGIALAFLAIALLRSLFKLIGFRS
jgi:hypothetical protein